MENNSNNAYFGLHTFNLLSLLLSILNTNDENDTDFIIARYFLENLSSLKDISIYKIADNCFVSRSSVQRFIKSLGYDSYTQLKAGLDNVIDHENGFVDYTDHASYSEYILEATSAMAQDICKTASLNGFKRFCDLFMKSDNIVLATAEDSSYACKIFQQQMLSIGKIIRITTNASINIPMLLDLNEKDLLLVCSVTGNFALAINNEISNFNATKCLITLNRTAVFENTYSFIYYIGQKVQLNSRNIVSFKNVYNNHGLALFFDLVYHECFLRTHSSK